MPEPLPLVLVELRALLLDPDRLVRAVATGRRRVAGPAWRRVELRPVTLQAGPRLQITRYDDRQAFATNLAWPDASDEVDDLLAAPFGSWHVEAVDQQLQVRVTKKGDAQVHRSAAVAASRPTAHDRPKERVVDPAAPFLRELRLTDAQGRVRPSRSDKYRQVEEFVRALDPVVREALAGGHLPAGRLHLVDLGCGNAYLTFAAHHHLTETLGLDVRTTGVDVKEQSRRHNTEVAQRLGWEQALHFEVGTIAEAQMEPPDIVLALHACDTATDDALARAVEWGATVVLAAPCCHHDLQRRVREAGSAPAAVAPVLRHGILRERLCDVLTDTLRAELLRVHGYRVDVVEFVGTEHTPRNVLIRGTRTGAAVSVERRRALESMVGEWGVTPRLAELLAEQ